MGGHRIFKPEFIHLPDYFETCLFIKRQLCLVKQAIGTCTTGLPTGIKPDTGLTYPYNQTSDTSRKNNCCMRYSCARFKHEAGNASDRNLSADAILVEKDKCSIEDVDFAFLKKNKRNSLFNRDWFQGGEHRIFPYR